MGMKTKSTTAEKLPTDTRDFRTPAGGQYGVAAVDGVTEALARGQQAASADSGTAAAVARLNKTPEPKTYVPRDFDKEARGKTRCAMFSAALMSPALAGAKWDTTEQFLELVQKAAEAGVKYSFQD